MVYSNIEREDSRMPIWIQWMMGVVLGINLPFTCWVAVKVIAVDKDLARLKAEHKVKCHQSEKMEGKVEKTHDNVIRIAAKLGVDIVA